MSFRISRCVIIASSASCGHVVAVHHHILHLQLDAAEGLRIDSFPAAPFASHTYEMKDIYIYLF